MSHPRRHVLFALLLIVVLLTVTLAVPYRMAASPVADFAAPMSAQEAQARVRVAQQADTQRRDAIAHTLGATSAESLPFVQNLFFSETNHHVSDRAGFLNYWRENGGVLLFLRDRRAAIVAVELDERVPEGRNVLVLRSAFRHRIETHEQS